MTKDEIKGMIFMLRSAYPSQVKAMSEEDLRAQLTLWYEMFKDDDPVVVGRAVKRIIGNSEFFPSIASVRKAVIKETYPNINEQFDYLLKHARLAWKHDVVDFKEVSMKYRAFDEMPKSLQEYVGSPTGLQDFLVEYDNNHSYCRNRFNREYPEILDKVEMDMRLGVEERRLLSD